MEGATALPATQAAAWHMVPDAYLRHAPAPLQVPSLLQFFAPRSVQLPEGSMPPAGTATHEPTDPGTAQDWQAPAHDVEQQIPCAQNALSHSLPAPHTCP